MRKALGFGLVAFALLAGTAAVTVAPQQAFACGDDHRGS
jgi:hypothetical protein